MSEYKFHSLSKSIYTLYQNHVKITHGIQLYWELNMVLGLGQDGHSCIDKGIAYLIWKV